VSGTGSQRSEVLSAVGGVIVAAFQDGADYAGKAIKGALTFDRKLKPSGEYGPENIVAPNIGGIAKFLNRFEFFRKQSEMSLESAGEQSSHLNVALKRLADAARPAAAAIEAARPQAEKVAGALKEFYGSLDAAVPAIDKTAVAAKEREKNLKERDKLLKDMAPQEEAKRKRGADEAAADAMQNMDILVGRAKVRADESKQKADDLKKMTLPEWIEQQKAKKGGAIAAAELKDKNENLQDKLARGIRLSKEDMEFLREQEALRRAQEKANQQAIDDALRLKENERLKREFEDKAWLLAQDDSKEFKQMRLALQDINKKLGLAP
jgi:hypothetical protein